MMSYSGSYKTAQQWIEDGVGYYKKRRYKEALWAFEHAIQIDPASVKALHGRGIIFARMGQYQKAIESYERALEIAPKIAQIYADMAEVFYKLKDYEKSGSCYRKAIAIDRMYEALYQKKIRTLFYNGIQLRSQGLKDETIRIFRRVLLFDPDNVQAVYYISEEENSFINYVFSSRQRQLSKSKFEQEQGQNNTGKSVFLTVHPFNCQCHECYEF